MTFPEQFIHLACQTKLAQLKADCLQPVWFENCDSLLIDLSWTVIIVLSSYKWVTCSGVDMHSRRHFCSDGCSILLILQYNLSWSMCMEDNTCVPQKHKTIMSTVRLNSHCTPSSFKTLRGKHMRSIIFSHTDQQFFTTGAEWQFTTFRSVTEARPLLPKFTIGFRVQTCSMSAADHQPSQQHQYLGFLHPLQIQYQEGNTEQIAHWSRGSHIPEAMLETAPWL